MSTIPPVGALAQRMRELSEMAGGAARLTAPGDWLNPQPADFATRVTTRANTLLKGLDRARAEHPDVLASPTGIDEFSPLQNAALDAHAALNGAELDVRAGLAALRDGIVIEDDVVRGGDTIIRDGAASGVASSYFGSASRRLENAANGLTIHSLSDAELMAKLLGSAD